MEYRVIKNFKLMELIATGGMASVYKATQISLDRTVALKLLHFHLAQDISFITRFQREAKSAAVLNHENIVSIIDYGESEGAYFIAMEYIEGKDLKWAMSSLKCLPVCRALAIAYEICQGLYYAHKKGVVHRDIKPSNILIGYDGVPKIADFGVAQAKHLASSTLTDSLLGTPAYMSPEQAAGRKVDERTDIFSLGVIIYEMIAGTKPFNCDTHTGLIWKIITELPAPLREIKPEVPPEVNAIVEKMLEKERDSRYISAFEVGRDILSYLRLKHYEISRKEIAELVVGPDDRLLHTVVEERRPVPAPAPMERISPAGEPAPQEVENAPPIRQKSAPTFRRNVFLSAAIAAASAVAVGTVLFLVFGRMSGPMVREKTFAAEEKKKTDTGTVPPAGAAPTREITAEVRRSALLKDAVPPHLKQRKAAKVQAPVVSPQNEFSFLKIKVEPWADIYLDDRYLETTPVGRPLQIPPGTHAVMLKNPNYKSWQRMVIFKPGDTSSLDVKLGP